MVISAERASQIHSYIQFWELALIGAEMSYGVYDEKLIGNPGVPALHGGAIAAFMEVSAVIELSWSSLWKEIEASSITTRPSDPSLIELPKTIDFTLITYAPVCPVMPCTGPRALDGVMPRYLLRHGRTTGSVFKL